MTVAAKLYSREQSAQSPGPRF